MRWLTGVKAWLAAGAVIAALGGALWLSVRRNAELGVELRQKDEAIQIYAESWEAESRRLAAIQVRFQAARDRESENTQVFNEHNLDDLIKKKPGLVAERATAGYERLFDAIEMASRGAAQAAPATP